MTTLQKVAKRAGVSIATVSKVLSNTPYFTEETRSKVLQAVNELGYVPNLAGRALSSGKTQIIGVVFPYIYDTVFTDPLVLRILEGIEAECALRGYNILLSTPRLSEQGLDENYLRLIRSGYLDGLVALDNVPLASVIQPAREKDLPAVAIGYHPHSCSVRSDDEQGGELLMGHLLGLGHRRIGIVSVPAELHFSIQHRHIGLQKAALAYGLNFEDFPLRLGDFSTPSGQECAANLLNQHPDLTAILCLNDRMALGAMEYAQETGRKIPADLSIVGYDDIPTSQFTALTTIDQKAPELGHLAVKMLFQLLNHDIPDSVLVPTELVIRQSSAPPNI